MPTKTTKTKQAKQELDTVYLLKLVLFLVLGSQWLYITDPSTVVGSAPVHFPPIPIGAIIGVLFAMHEHFQIDRKIEYAVLLIAMFLGFWLPLGITIIR